MWKNISNLKSLVNSRLRSLRLSAYYADISELPLKVFLRVSATGEYNLLQKKRSMFASKKLAFQLWSEILLQYGKADNNPTIQGNFDKIVVIKQLQNSYTTIKSMLRLLMYVSPTSSKHKELAIETINDLRQMGYIIDTSSSEAYKDSIYRADRKANSLITYIRMKQNELQGESDEDKVEFEDLIAMMQMHFNNINDDLTVKKYISYKKLIKSKYSKNSSKVS